MKLFNFLRKKSNELSQSEQDQYAYNLSGFDGIYLEVDAHDTIINSNTFNLEVKYKWNGVSIENLENRNYKIAVNDVYSKNEKDKVYET